MAVLQMQKLSICAMKRNRKAILELLQRRGAVEVCDEVEQDSVFEKADTSSACDTFGKNIATALAAIEVLKKYAPVKASMLDSLNGKPIRSENDYYAFEKVSKHIMDTAYEINAHMRRIAEHRAEIIKLQGSIAALSPWLNLDVPLTMKDTADTKVFIGYFPELLTLDALLQKLSEADSALPDVHAEMIGCFQNNTCVFILCKKADAMQVEQVIRSCGFSYPAVSTTHTPSEKTRRLSGQIETLNKEINEAIEAIKGKADVRSELEFAVDYYTMRREKYEVLGRLCQSAHTFVLTGFLPQQVAPVIEAELNAKFEVYVEISDLTDADDPPVLLKNNAFAAPVEGVLESFGLPTKTEIDPSAVMAFFYYVLFGLMFADAGYGLIMVAVCGIILLKFKNISSGLKKSLMMFFYCGISTTIWGFMFGGLFGNLLETVSGTFFGKVVTTPTLWFAPINEPMRMLIYSMAIGVIHLFTGLVLKAIQLIRQKQFLDVLYDVVFWLVIISSLIILLLGTKLFTDMSQMNIVMPAWVSTACTIAAAVSAIGIILTSGRESKNLFKRILKGLYGLYGVTGYLGDILSYSRLLALGLAGGVIATVINQMGSMMGGGVLGAVFFVIVFLIGHTLNFGINILGAYVHTNRLQFVEFFGKFYEGGGRKFAPFTTHTKFYHFKEENKNG